MISNKNAHSTSSITQHTYHSPVITTRPSRMQCKHTRLACLKFSPPSPPLIVSPSPAEENVFLRRFFITGTMGQSAVPRPPYQDTTQCHTSVCRLVPRLVQLRWIELLAQCCLTGMHWWLYPTCVSAACKCVHRMKSWALNYKIKNLHMLDLAFSPISWHV